jgi:hypothetical protein
MKLARPHHLNEQGFGWHFILPILAVIAVAAIGTYLLESSHAATLPDLSATSTTVTVNPNNVTTVIPARYLGFSFETSSLCNLTESWNTPTFQQLVKNLGPQVIRIGGNSADLALWNPNGAAECSGTDGSTKTVLNDQLVGDFFNLAHGLNSKVMWTLNLGNYAPDTYSNEANYVINEGAALGGSDGSFLWALGIGNEPDLYSGDLTRPASWPLSGGGGNNSFMSAWNSYSDTIRQTTNHPALKFMGPDVADNDTWFSTFNNTEQSVLSHTTHHYYAIHTNNPPYRSGSQLKSLSACSGVPSNIVPNSNQNSSQLQAEISQCYRNALLSKQLMSQAGTDISSWKSESDGVPLAIDEANSVTGGETGSSNTFASSLWGLDFLYTALDNGASQVNFHDTAGSPYTPIAFSDSGLATPQALYYAMLAFHYAAAAGNLVSTSVSSSSNVTAYSVSNNGALHVTIINKDTTATTVKITPGGSYGTANTVALTAPSISATTGQLSANSGACAGTVTLGNSSVCTNGTWTAAPTNLNPVNGKWAVSVPADSAMIVDFTK